ncbi:MAG: hypothetical protein ACE5GO_02565 [Anaerolineales bacterium]
MQLVPALPYRHVHQPRFLYLATGTSTSSRDFHISLCTGYGNPGYDGFYLR